MNIRILKALGAMLLWVTLISPGHGSEARDPQTVFDNFCFSCHGTGWEDAPVIGDEYAWEERKAQGLETLLKNTTEGLNGMPPKGACADCTSEELKAVVQWMIE